MQVLDGTQKMDVSLPKKAAIDRIKSVGIKDTLTRLKALEDMKASDATEFSEDFNSFSKDTF